MIRFVVYLISIATVLIVYPATADTFKSPWRDKDQALVIDAYERNAVDWNKMVTDKQIRAFIGKASDGVPPNWGCAYGDQTKRTLCRKTFKNYFMKQELYNTRRAIAKNLGLKWGAYHLGRPGNPVAQANHFLNFADPQPDELIALDIEHDNPKKWISFEDAEIFAKHIHKRLGRYPILYTNHHTAQRIAQLRHKYPLLSRLPLWYARFRSDITGVFPMGNWEDYVLWQFSSQANCLGRRCLYRVPGTKRDIDINATGMTVAEFEKAWPFDGLVPKRLDGVYDVSVRSSVSAYTEPAPVVRFAANYTIELEEGETLTLSAVAIPTRNIRALAEPTLEETSQKTDEKTGYSAAYRYGNPALKRHVDERYLN